MAYFDTAQFCDSTAYLAVAQWAATTAYTVGQIRRQLAAPAVGNERCFLCVGAGTSLASEPAWNLTRGAITQEASGPKWQEVTGQAAFNADSADVVSWAASTNNFLGVIKTDVARTRYFIVTTAGVSTTVEPTWNTTPGVTTTDNTTTWTCVGLISAFTALWAAPAARLMSGSVATNWLTQSGFRVYVGDDHSETGGNNNSLIIPGNFDCEILCVDHTATPPYTVANLRNTALVNDIGGSSYTLLSSTAHVHMYGINFTAINNGCGISCTTKAVFEQCGFLQTFPSGGWSIGSGSCAYTFKGCTFKNRGTNAYITPASGYLKFEDCVFLNDTATPTNVGALQGAGRVNVVFEGCDMGNVGTAPLFNSNTNAGYHCFKDSKISPWQMAWNGDEQYLNDSLVLDYVDCDTGNGQRRNERHTVFGITTTSTLVGRTNGAMDDGAPISHKITQPSTQVVNNYAKAYESISLAIWNNVSGTNRNITLYGIANDTRVPNNDEVGFDAEYQGSSSSTRGSWVRGFKSTQMGAASALTADTSAWDLTAATRNNSCAYALGDCIKVASNFTCEFRCITAGISSTSEPGGYTTATGGTTVTDGTATFIARTGSATTRVNSAVYTLGQVIKLASNPGRIFFCTTAGTSAAAEPGGYASAVDGGSVTDGTATFRAGCRFSITLTASSPQPAKRGYIYGYPKIGSSRAVYFIDPVLNLS